MNENTIALNSLKSFGECLLPIDKFKEIDNEMYEILRLSAIDINPNMIYQNAINETHGVYIGVKIGNKKIVYTVYKSLEGQMIIFDEFLDGGFKPVNFDEITEDFIKRGMLEVYHKLYQRECFRFGKIEFENYTVMVIPKN